MPRSEITINLLWPILDNLSTTVLAFDKELKLQFINPAGENLLAMSRKQAEGMELTQLMPRATELAEKLKNALQQGHMFTEYQVTLPLNGTPDIAVDYTVTPFGQTADEQCILLEMVNIDRHVQITREEHRLSQYEISREVVRGLAHEIKNPLTPIQLSAERLRHKYLKTMEPEDAVVLDKSTHTIVQQVEVMKEMVQAFSEYARTPKLERRPQALNHLIDEVLDLYRNNRFGVTIVTDLQDDLPLVSIDSGRMRQLLHNLIKNALEAMVDGEMKIELTTRVFSERGLTMVELLVSDSGPGIPATILENIFEPYVTAKPKGSGLGLAIVKKIVEEHSGVIWAENIEHGACMTIRLPAAKNVMKDMTPMEAEGQHEAGVMENDVTPFKQQNGDKT